MPGVSLLLSCVVVAGPAWAEPPAADAPTEQAPASETPAPASDTPPAAPADAAATPPDDATADDDPDEPLSRRERRKQKIAARYEAPFLPPEADFLKGDTDLKLRLAFNGYTPGPFSVLTAFAGWQEGSLTLDHGIANWKGFTVGFGFEGHYGQAFLLGALTQPIANYDDYTFRWRMWETGGTLRSTMHWTALQSVDPYLFVGAGAGFFHLDARVRSWPAGSERKIENPYLRIELGGGLIWRIPDSPFLIGGELRYLITSQFGAVRDLAFRRGDETAVFSLFPQHKPPKGFSWIVHLGIRIR